jgi:hypothetical protein
LSLSVDLWEEPPPEPVAGGAGGGWSRDFQVGVGKMVGGGLSAIDAVDMERGERPVKEPCGGRGADG